MALLAVICGADLSDPHNYILMLAAETGLIRWISLRL
jgi:hypothetical protein